MSFFGKSPNSSEISKEDRVRRLALWLLIWGEASLIRFMSGCLYFIFDIAIDFYNREKKNRNFLNVFRNFN